MNDTSLELTAADTLLLKDFTYPIVHGSLPSPPPLALLPFVVPCQVPELGLSWMSLPGQGFCSHILLPHAITALPSEREPMSVFREDL